MRPGRAAHALTVGAWCIAAVPFALALLMRAGIVYVHDDMTGFKGVGRLLYVTIASAIVGAIASGSAIALARRAWWAWAALLVHVTLLVAVGLLVADMW